MKKLNCVLSLLVVLVFAQGCVDNGLATQTEDDSLTFITFADELTGGLDEVFDTCVAPLEFTPGDTEIDLLGGCNAASDLTGDSAQTLYNLFSFMRDIEVDIPESIGECEEEDDEACEPTVIEVDFNDCEVTMDSTVTFHGLSFETLASSWSSYPGQPSLKIRLGNTAYPSSSPYYFRPISVRTDASIECNSGVITALAQAWLNGRMNAWGIRYFEIGYSDMDVDIYFKLSTAASGLKVRTAVYADLDGFELHSVDQDTWPDYLADEFEGMEEEIEAQLEALLKSQVSGLRGTVDTALETAIPSGHDVCDLDIVSGDFVMTTDGTDGDIPQCIAESEYLPDYRVGIIDAELVSSFEPVIGMSTYTYDVSCVVWNAGIAPAEDVSVLRLEDNTFRSSEVDVDPLDADATSTHTVRITSNNAIYDGLVLIAIADYDGDIDELDETNNEDEEDFLIEPIDFTMPEELGIDLMIERVCPIFEEVMVEEVFDAILMATDQCIMCDPWIGGEELALNHAVTSYLGGDAFQMLATQRAKGLITEVAFQEQVATQLVTAMNPAF
jgi:hypothetical protein